MQIRNRIAELHGKFTILKQFTMQIRNHIAELHGKSLFNRKLFFCSFQRPAAAEGGAELGEFQADILAGGDDVELR